MSKTEKKRNFVLKTKERGNSVLKTHTDFGAFEKTVLSKTHERFFVCFLLILGNASTNPISTH
jgi:hypothetical protein